MPKFKRPKKGCGLNLRAVIEDELMSRLPLPTSYEFISKVADAIETRIQDGPSDWLSLSDGTTFDKSWVPEELTPETYNEKLTQVKAQIDAQERDTRPSSPRVGFSPTGEDLSLKNFLKDHPVPYDPQLVKALDNINFEHDKRVAAHKLEKEIQAHEDWLESERENRIS